MSIKLAALIVALALYPGFFIAGCMDEKARFDAYKAKVEAAGKAQEERTKIIIERNIAEKEKADALRRVDLADLNERLRKQRARTVFVPTPTACPASADGVARYAAEYQRAYRDLVAGLRAQADRGSQATVDLNAAKRWAQGSIQ